MDDAFDLGCGRRCLTLDLVVAKDLLGYGTGLTLLFGKVVLHLPVLIVIVTTVLVGPAYKVEEDRLLSVFAGDLLEE